MTFLALLLLTGATARLVRLVQTDTILDRPRWWVSHRIRDRKVGELLLCPWCLSIWVAAVLVVTWVHWGDTRWWEATTAALTVSMATGLLNVWEDR